MFNNDDFEWKLEDENTSLQDILWELDFADLSGDKFSNVLFTNLIDSRDDIDRIKPEFKRKENLFQILDKMIEVGLDLNSLNGTFTYGQSIMRYGLPHTIEYAFEHGFNFNSYTTDNWHSLTLLQANYFGHSADKKARLKIIEREIKNIDLSRVDAGDFLTRLNRNKGIVGFEELLELYIKNDKINKLIMDNVDFIMANGLTHILPQEAKDLFLF